MGGGGGGGGELCSRPYSSGILHSVSDQIQNLRNFFTTPNKITNEDDIKGLVSLKFLSPWVKGPRKEDGRQGTDHMRQDTEDGRQGAEP